MKKMLIGALVGGILLFVWQFLSWSMLNVHLSQMSYSPNQTAILDCLSANLTEEGAYFMPTVAPGTSAEQTQIAMTDAIGKPWAQVSYHKAMSMSMGMNMTRGLIIDIMAVGLLCWLLLQFAELNFKKSLMASLAVGLISFLSISYLSSIWFETNSIPDLIDAVVSWGLVGSWLGWWLNRA